MDDSCSSRDSGVWKNVFCAEWDRGSIFDRSEKGTCHRITTSSDPDYPQISNPKFSKCFCGVSYAFPVYSPSAALYLLPISNIFLTHHVLVHDAVRVLEKPLIEIDAETIVVNLYLLW